MGSPVSSVETNRTKITKPTHFYHSVAFSFVCTSMFKHASVISLLPAAFAGFAKMEDEFQNMVMNATADRSVTSLMGATLNLIDQYGCWCYFEENHGKGKSQAVNDVDSFCKLLHEGYDCAMMDADEAGETCIPWEVDYNTGTSNLDTLVETCTEKNLGQAEEACATRACIVEQYFITNIFQLFLSGGGQHSPDFLHANGLFDVAVECPTKSGEVSEHSCCGPYPFRHPFKTYSGNRACCGSKTYDSNILTCCPDEKVRLSCQIMRASSST